MADKFVREPKTGEDTYDLWQTRINAALSWRQNHWNGDKAWKRSYRMFRGDHWRVMLSDQDDPSSDAVRDRITVNLTGSTVLSFLPFLVRKNPEFLVTARRPKFLVAAAIQRAILNYEWQARKMQRQIKRAVADMAICGHGIIKTGFILDINEDAATNPNLDGKIAYESYVTKEAPYIKRVSPFMFLFDPEAPEHDLESARWCGEIFFKPLQDIIANKQYDSKVVRQIKDGIETPKTVQSYLAETQSGSTPLFAKEELPKSDLERCVMAEIWDKKHMKYYVFAIGIPEPLIERPWPYPYLNGFPYHKVDFITLPDEHYPVGIPRWIEDQQFELNRIRTSMFEHRRRFNRKYVVVEGQVDPEEMNKLEAGPDGTVVLAKDINAIKALEDARLASDQIQTEAVIKQDVREITGADELLRGGGLPSRTTATEVSARANLVTLKLDDRIEAIDDFVKDICNQLIQHVKANYVTDKLMKVAGPQGIYWVNFTQEDIQGDFDIEIETTSAEKVDPSTNRAQALQILQIITQNLQVLVQSGLKINVTELFRYVFEQFNVKDIARIFPQFAVPAEPIQEPDGETGPAAAAQGNPVNTEVPASNLLPGNLATNPGQLNAAQFGQLFGAQSGGQGVPK